MAESKEELKSLSMQVKEESEKAGLKLNIQKTKIWFHRFMANRWGNNWNSDFIFGAPKSLQMVTAALELKDTCSLEETNLDSVLKSRAIPLPTKVHLVKAMVFPVVVYGCESWTIKKAEHRIYAFEL